MDWLSGANLPQQKYITIMVLANVLPNWGINKRRHPLWGYGRLLVKNTGWQVLCTGDAEDKCSKFKLWVCVVLLLLLLLLSGVVRCNFMIAG
jgi:hypothetical protein